LLEYNIKLQIIKEKTKKCDAVVLKSFKLILLRIKIVKHNNIFEKKLFIIYMVKKLRLKKYARQTLAIVEKNLYLELYVKSSLFMRYLNPIIQLFILIFIFGTIFSKKGTSIGYWNSENYILFLLIAFCIQFSASITQKFNSLLTTEKYWKTLSATLVAPINRIILLLGILISELIIISFTLIFLFILALILYPISLGLFILFILMFGLIYLIFASIGLIISAFGISHERYVQYSNIILRFAIMFACVNYPKEIFPEIIQFFIVLNPLYYIFELLRLIWYSGINYDIAISYITPIHIILFILLTITFPIISIYLFNKIFKKYGITGY